MKLQQIAFLVLFVSLSSILLIRNEDNQNPEALEFQDWKLQYSVKYQSQFQNTYRLKVYNFNRDKINAHNSNQSRSFDMGINQFADLTQEQYIEQYLKAVEHQPKYQEKIFIQDYSNEENIDWQTKGDVTAVKNQGSCGSGYAFSAVGAIQSLYKIKNGQLPIYSEQQVIDCSAQFGNKGCNGGNMISTFKFFSKNNITDEVSYPYKGAAGTCKTVRGRFKISEYLEAFNCDDLSDGIEKQPVSVTVDATNWQAYKSGIFNNCAKQYNHGTLLVGRNKQYWRIKNSWGKAWGESGFIRLARGNTCGICDIGSYPEQ